MDAEALSCANVARVVVRAPDFDTYSTAAVDVLLECICIAGAL